jgi:peroxiredoxin Q/BCP
MAKKKTATKKPAAKKSTIKKAVTKKPTQKKPAEKKAAPAHSDFLKLGSSAPRFKAMNEGGEWISSDQFKGKTLVVYFYPKDDTPGCTQESCDFRDHFGRLKKEGVEVLGVSKDSIASHQKFKNKYDLPFSLLSDESGELCEAFGVWKEKSMYGRKYMGIERTTVIISGSGKILKVYPKVSVKGHVDQVIEDIRTLKES